MGVQLSELVIKKEIELEDLKNKIIAVDFSNIVYQFLSSIRQRDGTPLMDSKGRVTSHLVGLFTRSASLLEKGIKICYVFDGKSPLLKVKELEEREYRKQLAEEKLREAKEKEDIEKMFKYSRQTVRLTSEIINESKEFIKAMGIPVIQAPSEAEAQCALMCKNGDVYAVGSQDYDSLLFGSPRLIQNLTLSQTRKVSGGAIVRIRPQLIELKQVLESLGINQEQLLVIAILIGTDFNKGGVKGIGPKNALKLVKKYNDFNKLFKEVKAEFDWKEIQSVFKNIPIAEDYRLKWHDVDENSIKEILIKEHNFSEERVENTLNKLRKKDREQIGLSKWA